MIEGILTALTTLEEGHVPRAALAKLMADGRQESVKHNSSSGGERI